MGVEKHPKPAKKLPDSLDIVNWRAFAPPVVGATIWFESATARIRAAYPIPGSRVTRSQTTLKFSSHSCVLWCLQWMWNMHEKATGTESPMPALRGEPGPTPPAAARREGA